MKARLLTMVLFVVVISSLTAYGQIKRTDAIWARNATGTITLDGKLTEPEWATAESLKVQMGHDSGIPGGGWFWENGAKGPDATDPTNATLKFLAKGDTLYIALVARDKSVGGGLFNHFDGFISNLRYRQADGFQGTPFPQHRTNEACELFYGWVTESWAADTLAGVKGAPAGFFGDFPSPYLQPRPDSLRTNFWDAASYVQGITNSDTTADTSWTVELKINLKSFGYNVTQGAGDIVMWSMSVYDADYQWPIDSLKQSANRVWVQCPWSNASVYNHLRIFVRSDVTTSSGAAPVIGPDYTIPNAQNYTTPTIDGQLTEDVWKHAPTLQMQYGNAAIRNAYANTAKYRSGQVQPTVNGAQNAVLDPNLALVHYFFKGDQLFLGFDVADKCVQFDSTFGSDRWDGFRVVMESRDARNGDSVLAKRRLTFIVGPTGTVSRQEDLSKSGWDSLGTAVNVAVALKPGTTVDTTWATDDAGYTAEMQINLQSFGYPAGRGDGVVFLSITEFDGDSFSGGSYGTNTWFMRQSDGDDGAAWMYMDPTSMVTAVKQSSGNAPAEFALLGSYPNPFNPTTNIKFQMAHSSNVTLEVYDVLGRLVSSQALGIRTPGEHVVPFNAANLASGTYFYRLKMLTTGATLIGKMMLLK
jgi:Secretion system C-terminal sorting domain